MKGIIFDIEKDLIRDLLPYFDAQFDIADLLPDIELQTPKLINFIGREAYSVAVHHYDPTLLPESYDPTYQPEVTSNLLPYLLPISLQDPNEDETILLDGIVRHIRTYLITLAAVDYMQSGDLEHTTSGRKMSRTDNQVTPWEWQINRDNAAHYKRAYRSLDMLFQALDELNHSSWTDSKAFTRAKSLYVFNTQILDDIYPINDSGQLYRRLVPFMADHETESITPILGTIKNGLLKIAVKAGGEDDLDADDKKLLSHVRKAVVFLSLADGYELLPVEMFPDNVDYNMKPKDYNAIWAEKVQRLRERANLHLRNVEQQMALITTSQYSVPRDPLNGLDDDAKHVSL